MISTMIISMVGLLVLCFLNNPIKEVKLSKKVNLEKLNSLIRSAKPVPGQGPVIHFRPDIISHHPLITIPFDCFVLLQKVWPIGDFFYFWWQIFSNGFSDKYYKFECLMTIIFSKTYMLRVSSKTKKNRRKNKFTNFLQHSQKNCSSRVSFEFHYITQAKHKSHDSTRIMAAIVIKALLARRFLYATTKTKILHAIMMDENKNNIKSADKTHREKIKVHKLTGR